MGNVNYNQAINTQRSMIASCLQKNEKLEDDIKELKATLIKMKKLLESMENISSKSKGKITDIPDLFFHKIKLNVFFNMLDAIKGSKYTSAIKGINAGIEQISSKIKEYERQIEANSNTIKNCQSNISSLKTQREKALKKE